LADLLDLDVELMARVGNLPVRNLRTWLAGKKENLRPQSVINLMTMLGLKVDSGIRLDCSRVHYWTMHDGTFSRRKTVYQPLTALSKLMSGCSITTVKCAKPSLTDRFLRTYYLISGNGVRVVVCVDKGLLKRAKISPEVIKGASWRDDTDHHSIQASARMWNHLIDRDLTTFEFDSIFNQTEESVSWGDVSLMAREFGVTASDAAQWIAEKFGDAEPAPVAEDDQGFDLDGSGKLLLMIGTHSHRRAA
jgi:hypothetical protein